MNDIITRPDSLGHCLRLLREREEKTLDWLASKTGRSKSFLAYVEQGKRSVHFEDLLKITRALGYPLGYFLSNCIDELSDSYLQDDILQTSENHVLIAKSDEIDVRLLRPVYHRNDEESVLIEMAKNAMLTKEKFAFEASVLGVVLEGNLLVEIEKTERVVKKFHEFRIPAKIPFALRNPFENQSRTLLVFSSGEF